MKTHAWDSHVVPLLPCAHCGGPAEFVEEDGKGADGKENDLPLFGWWARCTRCSSAMGSPSALFESRLDLCAAWNARAELVEPPYFKIPELTQEAAAKAVAWLVMFGICPKCGGKWLSRDSESVASCPCGCKIHLRNNNVVAVTS
jgi:DNA-directed RNA polymerase subunit RPC12/RpoP